MPVKKTNLMDKFRTAQVVKSSIGFASSPISNLNDKIKTIIRKTIADLELNYSGFVEVIDSLDKRLSKIEYDLYTVEPVEPEIIDETSEVLPTEEIK